MLPIKILPANLSKREKDYFHYHKNSLKNINILKVQPIVANVRLEDCCEYIPSLGSCPHEPIKEYPQSKLFPQIFQKEK
jgi:hypothetical protein